MATRIVRIPRVTMLSIVITDLPEDISLDKIEQRCQVRLSDQNLDIGWDTQHNRVIVLGAKKLSLEMADSTSASLTIQDVLTALEHEDVELDWIQEKYEALALMKNPAGILRVSDPILSQFVSTTLETPIDVEGN
jgi:hypothetical protein